MWCWLVKIWGDKKTLTGVFFTSFHSIAKNFPEKSTNSDVNWESTLFPSMLNCLVARHAGRVGNDRNAFNAVLNLIRIISGTQCVSVHIYDASSLVSKNTYGDG